MQRGRKQPNIWKGGQLKTQIQIFHQSSINSYFCSDSAFEIALNIQASNISHKNALSSILEGETPNCNDNENRTSDKLVLFL